ncbi:MFS transporter [Pseudonocardia yuanmonensis]|uniref:MFS transporter n=1 Tax=Pseudonocardia yuanmonensis TaxID=1095914 RepID=UPI0031E72B1E
MLTAAGRRRLAPLFAAVFLQNLALWVPIEKLFMTGIGFDAAGVGVMAAVYAAVVPLFEVPSGLLADRWSRRGVLVLGSVAAAASVAIGGLSRNVPTYLVAAVFLGLFFAMQSGTVEAIVYDTILEETGASTAFEATTGRLRLVESGALVVGALAGGVIAEVVSLRATYFLTVPLLIGACLALLAFREPRLHRADGADESTSLRDQVRATYRVILQPGRLRLVIAVTVAGTLLMQSMLEFGPLWLVALAVPAFVYGPHWAGLTAALGLGGLLGARPWWTRRPAAVLLALMIVACCLILTTSRSAPVVIAAQVVLTTLVVAGGIPVLRRLHDGVPSAVRAGVASGVGTLTWVTFVPFALAIGFLSDRAGVGTAGWALVAIGVAAGILLVVVLPGAPPPPPAPPGPVAGEPAFPADRFLPDDDPAWPGHWASPPREWADARVDDDATLAEVRAAVLAMPPELRQVIVQRDVEGRSAEQVCAALGLDAADEIAALHRARGLVRERLEHYFERRNP